MLTTGEMALRLALATGLGGFIGYERGQHHHPAGLRTHILVTLAATLFTLISTQLPYFTSIDPIHGVSYSFDPSRIASYVIAGMGFLGAGSIRNGAGRTKGLTTAASLWLVTAVGMSVAVGMYRVAALTVGAALVVLRLLRRFERKGLRSRSPRRINLVLDREMVDESSLIDQLRQKDWRSEDWAYRSDLDAQNASLTFTAHFGDAELTSALRFLRGLNGVRKVGLDHPHKSA